MNNKSDKKHKTKTKPKPKNKKKTTKTTQSKKKNEIKTGGGLLSSVKDLFSKNKNGLESLLSKTINTNNLAPNASNSQQLPNPNNLAPNASTNQQQPNTNNLAPNASNKAKQPNQTSTQQPNQTSTQQPLQSPEIPTIQPNATPSGFTAIFKKSIVFSNKNIAFLYFYINYFIYNIKIIYNL